MPQSLAKILLHIVFATKYRVHSIPDLVLPSLHAYIAEQCRRMGAEAYRVGGTGNHIHVACSLPRTITVARLLEEIKKASSKWMKARVGGFQWQDGYGVFSISTSHIRALISYIEMQEDHHRRHSFEDEVKGVCIKNNIPYDAVNEFFR